MSAAGEPAASTATATGATVLDRIVARTRVDLEHRKQAVPAARLPAPPQGAGAGPRFEAALRAPGLGVIAEFKRRSPSAGTLREGAELHEMLAAYERGGAVAFSVLTDEPHFDGRLQDLREARGEHGLPVLRKDFIVDPYQLQEARSAGADAVLLIVAALSQEQLVDLRGQARELSLDVLVEVHDAAELERALAAGATLIGINNRDLRDFSVDVDRTRRLLDQVPDGVAVVSESGIGTAEQLLDLERAGVSAVLIGESLMRAPDPAAKLRSLLAGAPGAAG
ncbi:MAG TPA: indole-3-glycerol phosphate synthase TrpC [Solirubrobacteraceae bacterium]|nr:indole-3-glycerol phosphate synthase TrpC [Solirubrobacteraceae bacterium]